jgi:hypothetical protein
MFANLFQFFHRRSASDYDRAFVAEVRLHRRIPRNRRSERLIVLGWLLVAFKSWAMFWLVERYAMPFDPWWIVGPTVLAAAVCTWIYVRRE